MIRGASRTALASVTVSAMGDMRLYLSRPVKLRSGSYWQRACPVYHPLRHFSITKKSSRREAESPK